MSTTTADDAPPTSPSDANQPRTTPRRHFPAAAWIGAGVLYVIAIATMTATGGPIPPEQINSAILAVLTVGTLTTVFASRLRSLTQHFEALLHNEAATADALKQVVSLLRQASANARASGRPGVLQFSAEGHDALDRLVRQINYGPADGQIGDAKWN